MTRYGYDELIERLKSTTNTIKGAAIVSVNLVVVDGEIVVITRPEVKNVEPRARRDEFIRLLMLGQ